MSCAYSFGEDRARLTASTMAKQCARLSYTSAGRCLSGIASPSDGNGLKPSGRRTFGSPLASLLMTSVTSMTNRACEARRTSRGRRSRARGVGAGCEGVGVGMGSHQLVDLPARGPSAGAPSPAAGTGPSRPSRRPPVRARAALRSPPRVARRAAPAPCGRRVSKGWLGLCSNGAAGPSVRGGLAHACCAMVRKLELMLLTSASFACMLGSVALQGLVSSTP